MNKDLTPIIRNIGYTWDSYFKIMAKYNEEVNYASLDVTQYSYNMFKLWCEASKLFGEYTKAIREFTNSLTWDKTITVAVSGEIIGISAPGCAQVYINAFVSNYDNAIARYGTDNKIFVRLGGLPPSTFINTHSGIYIVKENGDIVPYVRPDGSVPLKLTQEAS